MKVPFRQLQYFVENLYFWLVETPFQIEYRFPGAFPTKEETLRSHKLTVGHDNRSRSYSV